ncbi:MULTISPECIES: FdhD/NarQ family protein [Bradyrhizobium]|jgi:formate dehydrogenase assembly factor FdhD|uniref:FdhD/NarQ family protein n=1 Tax=Bradyrhizobium TaxID=374 RepID=UPI000396173A|nr:FdhD/NarQ family protein [Bradyrhizobium viridifuturi]ERF81868.1 MAG: formate dehydrogenase family accessory protein FdhD [Bradyrhizobium sp. DFCI-1]
MITGSTCTPHDEIAWRGNHSLHTSRLVAEETAIALSYDGSTHAVMMATPSDLEEFGIGFTLTEGIVEHVSEIETIEVRAPLQSLNQQTRSLHAAAFWHAAAGFALVREDVGRHNALDKLAGAVSADGHSAPGGAVLLTSRVSVEKVQKTAVIGVPFVIAMSPPTTLAIGTAEGAGITLLAMMDTAYSRTRIASFWPDDRRGKPLVDR